MSSKRTRFLSFPKFSKTNLQKVLSAKSRRRSIIESSGYESLEARQLLTADIGLSFPTVNDGSALNSTAAVPNISAAVGENHIVQFVNDGYAIYNKADGSLASQQPGGVAPTGNLAEFFTFAAQGLVPGDANGQTRPLDQIELTQPRVVFDSGFDRWYVTTASNEDWNGGLLGDQASRAYLAASVTSDPTGNWKSARIQLTRTTLATGELDRNISNVNLSVDEASLTITARQAHPGEVVTISVGVVDDDGVPTGEMADVDVIPARSANGDQFVFSEASVIASIPQVALFGGDIEANRFEIIEGVRSDPDADFNIDPTGLTTLDVTPAPDLYFGYPTDGNPDGIGAGYELQVGFDSTIAPQQFPVTSTASIWSLAINSDPDGSTNPFPGPNNSQGMQLSLTEWVRPGLPDGSSQNVELNFEQGSQTLIDVPFFRQPDVVRQPGDIIRDRSQTMFNATVAQEGDFLYAVHAVRGGADDLGANSTLRWYKVFVGDGTPANPPGLVQTDRIQLDEDTDLINPSIDVSENGTVAIGYTISGHNEFPSSYVSLGIPSEGNDPFSPLVFNDPTLLKAGESVYIDELTQGFEDHFWGRYTTTYNDPYDPNNFWTFQQYTDADNNWAVQATQVGPSNTTPFIEPDIDLDNVIEVNQVGDNIEVVIDGTLVGTYDSDGIGTLTVNGNGGVDQFIVNVDNLDAPEISGSYILVGDGNDTVRSNAMSDTTWVFDGANGVNVNSGRILASGMIEFYSGSGDDRFEFPTSNYDFPVFAGEGNDTFVLAQDITGNLQLFGEVGDDDYRVPNTSFAGITISDTLMTENDNLTTSGTDGDDIINVSATSVNVNGIEVPFDDALNLWGIETFEIDGLDGDDVFNVTSTTQGVTLFGQRGDDTFNVVETSVMTGALALVIDGGTGNNSLNVSQNDALTAAIVFVDDALITNMTSAEISFNATGGTFSETATSTGITLTGSDTRADVFEIVGVAAGNDLKALGRAFDDRFIFENTIDGTAELLGGADNDRYETNAASIIHVVVTDSVAAEADVLYVGMTEGDDVIEVNETGYLFNGVAYPTPDASFSGIEDFALDGLGGADTFHINRTTTIASFFGSEGDDLFNVTDLTVTAGASATNIDGGAGLNELNIVRNEFSGSQAIVNESTIEGMTLATINYASSGGLTALINLLGTANADDFVVQTLLQSTILLIDAGSGDDMMLVERAAAGTVDLTGGFGADTYRVEVQGDKARLVRVIDPSSNPGADRAEVVYTTAADDITLDGRVVGLGSDLVDVDPAVEVLALEGLGGDDRFNIIAPVHPRVEFFGQAGDDIYDIQDLGALSSEIAIFDSVDAENDTLLVTGTINLDEFVINEDSVTINGVPLTSPGAGTIIGVEGITFDGREADDIFRINSTTQGFNYLGSEGNDRFFITDATVTTGASSFLIDGGAGDNEMFVSRAAILGGAAAGTEIQIEDNRIVGMTTADINYRATDGIFSLIEVMGSKGTTAGDSVYDDIFRVNTLSDQTFLDVRSLGGNDVIHVRAAAAGDVMMDGGLGDDSFLVELGGSVDRLVTVDDSGVNLGYDRLDVFFSDAAETINVIESLPGDRISYAVGSSSVDFDPTFEALALHALGGDDRFVVSGTTTDDLILAGGDGDDTYELSNVFGSTMVSVLDSVNAENDRLVVSGTNAADTFEINENSFLINGNVFIVADATNANIVGIESLEVDALDGDDTFIVNSATRGFNLLGGGGNDSFMINDTAADAGADDLFIDGGTGANTMDIQRIAGTPVFAVVQETFISNVANSTIRYAATGGSFMGGNGGITIRGLDAVNESYLVFGLLSENSLQLLGGGGNDYHRITENVQGDVWMDGALGRDRYVFFLDENKSRSHRVADSGNDGEIDRINAFLGQNSDEVVLDGTEIALMNDRMSFAPTIETVEILAGDGDDRIEVRQFDGVRFLRIKGQNGNDVFTVNRAQGVENVFLIGEAGNDTFNLAAATQTGYLSANGGDGEDFIRVGDDFYRNANINGGNDDDRYDISFADRGRRNLAVADTGAGGNDTAIIRASDVSTQLTLRASGINSPFQLIGTTRQIESLELIGTEGRDIVTMFAAPIVNMAINTLTGSDILTINSNNGAENLNINLGAEQDVANIVATAPGTTTTLDLGRDDDLVNIGSHLAADSGNLDALQGNLSIEFGLGSDRLYVNDSQSSGAHGYNLTGNQVVNDASVRARNFSGISYSGAEFLQMRGNAQFNQFTVTPSSTVKYLLDGNLPQTNRLTVTGSADGRQLFTSGDFSGIWTFDSLRDIQFEQFAI